MQFSNLETKKHCNICNLSRDKEFCSLICSMSDCDALRYDVATGSCFTLDVTGPVITQALGVTDNTKEVYFTPDFVVERGSRRFFLPELLEKILNFVIHVFCTALYRKVLHR